MTRIEELEEMLETCSHCGEGQFVEEAEETNKCTDCEQELLEDEELEELDCLRLARALNETIGVSTIRQITNTKDIINSSDIVKRIEEIEIDIDCAYVLELEELKHLKAIVDQASGHGNFKHRGILIHESYFSKYCEQLCRDAEVVPAGLSLLIASNINWDGVAELIQQYYTKIDFDGIIYFMTHGSAT